jgi:hypothetical protein
MQCFEGQAEKSTDLAAPGLRQRNVSANQRDRLVFEKAAISD